MDMTTLIIIFVVIALVMFFLNRNRTMSRGYGNQQPTYDDPNYTSSGSIGGANQPTYDDPNYTSSGSIGGAPNPEPAQERGVGDTTAHHDDPKYRSGGSIGG